MNTTIIKVGIREFREHLPQYLMTTSPVAVTRHGETIGFYIPAQHHHPDKAQLEALKKAAEGLEKLLSEHNVTEDALFAEYRTLRKNKKEQRKQPICPSKERGGR